MRTASLVTALAGVLFVASAYAGPTPQTGSLTVTATVAASCLVVGPNTLAFGPYDPTDINNATALDAAGSLNIRCTKNTLAHVQLGQGGNAATGSDCTTPLRQMASGTERLGYTLYSNSLRTTIWGCTGTNESTFTSANSGTATNIPVYGRIAAGQNVAAGNYSDTVTINVTF
jgi:spore coat protein U-like protein